MTPHSTEIWSQIAKRRAQVFQLHFQECELCSDTDTLCSEGAELADAMIDAEVKAHLTDVKEEG